MARECVDVDTLYRITSYELVDLDGEVADTFDSRWEAMEAAEEMACRVFGEAGYWLSDDACMDRQNPGSVIRVRPV